MSANLDRSLDEILAARPRQNRRGGKAGAPAAPAAGIRKKSTRVAAQRANVSVAPNAARSANGRAPPTGPANKVTASKIIVSNLVCLFPLPSRRVMKLTALQPLDVSEHDIKVRRLYD